MTGPGILLVEDNADDELLTLRALRKNHITADVTVARDGAEALDLLIGDRHGQRIPPGLILLDLNLPLVNGLEVLRRMRAHDCTQFIPVVVLTSSKEHQDVAASYRAGANAYVRKPVSFAEFAAAVATVGAFWLQLNEYPDPGTAPDDRRS